MIEQEVKAGIHSGLGGKLATHSKQQAREKQMDMEYRWTWCSFHLCGSWVVWRYLKYLWLLSGFDKMTIRGMQQAQWIVKESPRLDLKENKDSRMTDTNQRSKWLGEAEASISSQEKGFAVSYCSWHVVCADLQLWSLFANGLLREIVNTRCTEGARSFIPAISLHDTTRTVILSTASLQYHSAI